MFISYSILQHGAMVGDGLRLDAYLEAIRRVVRPGDVVVDLGSGTGVFAVAACRAGARRVYAIEPGGIVQVAREVVAANDCAACVEFIEDVSTNVTLSERADVVVLDVRGVLPDLQIPVAFDARRRLLREDGRIIPAADTIWAAPVSSPALYEQHVSGSADEADDVNTTPIRQDAASRWYKCRVSSDALVTVPQCVAMLDYCALDTPEVRSCVEWTVPRSCTAHGFVAWFDSALFEDVALSNSPLAPALLYGQAYFPWPEPAALVEGQRMRLDWVGRPTFTGYSWSWTTSLFERNTDRLVLRMEAPARKSSWPDGDQSPALTAAASIDREILDLMATGSLSVSEIALEIQRRHPARFSRFTDALTWVGGVSNLYRIMPDAHDQVHEQVARELWQSAQLQGDRLERSLKLALDPVYWKALVPELSVGEESGTGIGSSSALDPATAAAMSRRFDQEGYLEVPPVVPLTTAERMCKSIGRLEAADWPPVFAWVFDEFWWASRITSLGDLFASILGPGYRQTPYVWTHVVAGARGATGWPPHVDSPGDALRLTVWIPLTDATVETGCMCLIPKHVVPPSRSSRWYEHDTMPTRDALELLHFSRPLPARAGSVLAWHAGLLHWGLARQAEGDPRISLSMELVPAIAEPALLADSFPATSANLPTHDERLRIIARAIALYQRNEPRVARYLPLAARLIAHTERSGS